LLDAVRELRDQALEIHRVDFIPAGNGDLDYRGTADVLIS
jgi:hypothetical protein